MGFFSSQFSNVVEWNESRDDVMFWMWRNNEIKKNSRLIIRPGQDAIFLYNGKIEGIFEDEGNYEIASEIFPFLTTLSSFKFGFNTPLRAEVLFVNTKEFLIRFGTKTPVYVKTEQLPGGLPIRCFGSFTVKIDDYTSLIEQIAGVKQQFTVEDVKERTIAMLDQLLMKWIAAEGKDVLNLQLSAAEIASGIKTDLDMQLLKIGLTVTGFTISSFTYPENIQEMINKAASFTMVGDVETYTKLSAVEAMSQNPSNVTSQMMQAGLGAAMGSQMMASFNQAPQPQQQVVTPTPSQVQATNGCVGCGHNLAAGAKFCPECGLKVEAKSTKFCTSCGTEQAITAKFCSSCGHNIG